tara:strand:- start:6319 stop:6897 length:579 start_codon:yes stop_codon:yes gene_type:complete
MNKIFSLLLITFTYFFSCNKTETLLPKQNGFLRLDIDEPKYIKFTDKYGLVNFYFNSNATKINYDISGNILLNYTDLDLSVKLSKSKIENLRDLKKNILDFNLILETHSKKSNAIFLKEYENKNNDIFGKLYELTGDVAIPIQFYLTDSLSYFINGSLNLNSKSDYDSIFPSIEYVKKDIFVLVESLNLNFK